MTKPTEVVDVKTENGIKWSAILQGVTLAFFISVGSVGFVIANDIGSTFANNILDRMDNIYDVLIDVKKEVSLISTTGKLNGAEIKHIKEDFSSHRIEFNDLKVDVNLIKSSVDKNSTWINDNRKRPNYAGE